MWVKRASERCGNPTTGDNWNPKWPKYDTFLDNFGMYSVAVAKPPCWTCKEYVQDVHQPSLETVQDLSWQRMLLIWSDLWVLQLPSTRAEHMSSWKLLKDPLRVRRDENPNDSLMRPMRRPLALGKRAVGCNQESLSHRVTSRSCRSSLLTPQFKKSAERNTFRSPIAQLLNLM